MTDATTLIYHLGAPREGMDGLTSSLRKDNERMGQHRAMARWPKHYRNAIYNRMTELKSDDGPEEDADTFLTNLSQGMDLDRFVISDGNFLSPLDRAFSSKGLYPAAAEQIAVLPKLFPDNPCAFYLEIRDPVTFVPEVARLMDEEVDEVLGTAAVEDFRWSSVLENIQSAAPDCPITVWTFEARAEVWPDVLRHVAGFERDVPMNGDLDQVMQVLSDNAATRLEAFLADKPDLSLAQRRHVIQSFLDAAVTDPVDAMSDSYTDDLGKISQMSGITLIS